MNLSVRGSADEPAPLRLHLLGAFRVEVGGQPISTDAWRLRKSRSLVKLLGLAPRRRLHREHLQNLLWPNAEPAAATNNFHQTLHAARRALDPDRPHGTPSTHLVFAGDMLALQPSGGCWIDVVAFEAATAAAKASGDPTAYKAALDLYDGDLLPDDRYEDWAMARREELRAAFVALLVEQAALYEGHGEPASAVEALGRALAVDPAHEAAHAALMRLYAGAGQRGKALRQYERLREALRRDLDAEPDPASQRLHAEILAGRFAAHAALRQAERPARISVDLPAPLTSFVGRTRDIVALERLLPTTRLLTLTGPGGSGKTRLAIELVRGRAADHPGGVRLIELAALVDSALLAHAVAAALGIREEPGRPAAAGLVDYLRPRRLLLILDNCEHLAAACAVLAAELLRACPDLRVVATSREPLGAAGELLWPVPPLSTPDVPQLPGIEDLLGYDAIRLFVERARFSQPRFALTPRNAAAVVRVCRRLDGLPLAIELAAARVRVLSVAQIAARLDDRFDLLTGGGPDVPPRQRALRATMAWSHDLLSEKGRRLFRRLSVFAGNWSIEAAQAVCAGAGIEPAEVLDLLTRLVDRSLVATRAPAD